MLVFWVVVVVRKANLGGGNPEPKNLNHYCVLGSLGSFSNHALPHTRVVLVKRDIFAAMYT